MKFVWIPLFLRWGPCISSITAYLEFQHISLFAILQNDINVKDSTGQNKLFRGLLNFEVFVGRRVLGSWSVRGLDGFLTWLEMDIFTWKRLKTILTVFSWLYWDHPSGNYPGLHIIYTLAVMLSLNWCESSVSPGQETQAKDSKVHTDFYSKGLQGFSHLESLSLRCSAWS